MGRVLERMGQKLIVSVANGLKEPISIKTEDFVGMKEFAKKYQLWGLADQRNQQYAVSEFDSLEECIAAPKDSNDWYITKKVSLTVTDAADQPVPFATPIDKSDQGRKSNTPGSAEPLPRKYEDTTVATSTDSVIA